jgi:uncharacterized iron-regulated protein
LPAPALQAQQQAIREGHCDMLPESQIAPMTRIQIARDRSIAQTLAQSVTPGKTVVLLAGTGHVDRRLGVPQYLPPSVRSTVIALRAGPDRAAATDPASFDTAWQTAPVPPKDYCAEFRKGGMPRS